MLLNRKSERSEQAHKQLPECVPEGNFDPIHCDLKSFASVRSAMEEIKSRYDVLDVLVQNAGVMALKDQAITDVYDVQMQTNVISHFLND